MTDTFEMTIEGRAHGAAASFEVLNPATEAVIATAPDCSRAQLDAAVAAALRANPPDDARVVQEEGFRPVLPLLRYGDVEEAIARADACEYGLGGSVWSSDHDAAAAVAARLETGTVWINAAHGLTPFAGHKQSGIGSENGKGGLLEFTVPQIIYRPVAA